MTLHHLAWALQIPPFYFYSINKNQNLKHPSNFLGRIPIILMRKNLFEYGTLWQD